MGNEKEPLTYADLFKDYKGEYKRKSEFEVWGDSCVGNERVWLKEHEDKKAEDETNN